MARIAGRFSRVEPRRRVRRLVLGLLSDLPRKNCWTIAEWAGEPTPDAMQHLLSRAKWDADAVRDDVRGYVVEHLHDERAVRLPARPPLCVDGRRAPAQWGCRTQDMAPDRQVCGPSPE